MAARLTQEKGRDALKCELEVGLLRCVRTWLALAATALTACAEPSPTATQPVWVYIASTSEGVEYRVNSHAVELNQLDQEVLNQVAVANPGLSEEQLRREVRIYMRTDPGIESRTLTTAMQRLRFEKIGFVAEDRRR